MQSITSGPLSGKLHKRFLSEVLTLAHDLDRKPDIGLGGTRIFPDLCGTTFHRALPMMTVVRASRPASSIRSRNMPDGLTEEVFE